MESLLWCFRWGIGDLPFEVGHQYLLWVIQGFVIASNTCSSSDVLAILHFDDICGPEEQWVANYLKDAIQVLHETGAYWVAWCIVYYHSSYQQGSCSVIGLHSTVRRNSWLYKVTPQTPSLPCRNRVWPCETNNNQCFLLWCMLTIFPVCVCFHFVLTFVISSHVYPGMMLHITVTQKQKWKTDWLTGQWEGYGSTLVT